MDKEDNNEQEKCFVAGEQYTMFIVAIQCMLIYFVALVYYLKQTKRKMYLRSGFLILGYAGMYISRFVDALFQMPFLYDFYRKNAIMVISKSLNLVLLNWIWVALYFFLFQIERINMTLVASNHQLYRKSIARKNRINNTILVTYFIAILVFDSIEIYDYYQELKDQTSCKDRNEDVISLREIIKFVAIAVLRVSDLYLCIIFFLIISYYYLKTKIRFRNSPHYDEATWLGLPNGKQLTFCITVLIAVLNLIQWFFDISQLVLEIARYN